MTMTIYSFQRVNLEYDECGQPTRYAPVDMTPVPPPPPLAPSLGPFLQKQFAKHMYLFIFILTPIHRGIGGLGALGDCGRDMCPENNQSIAHTWRQSAQSPGGRKPDASHRFGIRSFRPIRNNQPIATPFNGPLFLLYTHM